MAVQISGNDITVPRDGTFNRNVSIAGTLTYEDVTNVDSIGLVTARNGIEVGASPGVAASISVDGNMIVSGISTFGGDVQVSDKIIHSGDTNTAIRFPSADTITAETGGSERVRITSDGKIGIGDNNPNYPLVLSYTDNTTYSSSSFIANGLQIENDSTTDDTASGIFFTAKGSGANAGAAHINCIRTANGSGTLAFSTRHNAGSHAERLRIGSSGEIGIAGANYGTSGQVLQSQGSGSAVQWATPASGWVHGSEVSLNGNVSITLTGVPDGASHIRYLIRYMSFDSTAQPRVQLQKSTTGGTKSIITSGYQSYATYHSTSSNSGGAGGNTDCMDIFEGYSNALNALFGSVDIYRIGTNGSDGTNYFIQHQGVANYDGTLSANFLSNSYIELGTNSTDFISGAKFYGNTGESFDNGYINQSYLLS